MVDRGRAGPVEQAGRRTDQLVHADAVDADLGEAHPAYAVVARPRRDVSCWFQDVSANQASLVKRSVDEARPILELEQVAEAQSVRFARAIRCRSLCRPSPAIVGGI